MILGVAVLAEGFDCPQLQTVFCRPSVKGPTVQMAGRVLRKAPGIPLKTIVQCAATKHPFPATATPAVQYVEVEEGWRSIGLNDRVERATARMLDLLVRMSKREARGQSHRDESDRAGHRARRGVRRIAPWRYSQAEALDRFERRGGRAGG